MLDNNLKDLLSIAAKRNKSTQAQTKPEMLISMVKGVQKLCIEDDYLLAEPWFGTNKIIIITD